jgi:tetrahydromethanopterin S-methyltransferase subunit B
VAGEIAATLAKCIADKVQAEWERDKALVEVLELREQLEKLTAAQANKVERMTTPTEN